MNPSTGSKYSQKGLRVCCDWLITRDLTTRVNAEFSPDESENRNMGDPGPVVPVIA
jgi:hypothetical protein